MSLRQGRSQPRRSGGAQHLADGHGVGVRKCLRSRRRVTPEFFLNILNTKSCILMHSLAPKIGTASVFLSRILSSRGNEDCWEMLPNEAREAENRGRRPRAGVGFLGKEQQAPSPAARGSGEAQIPQQGLGRRPDRPKVFHYFQHSG